MKRLIAIPLMLFALIGNTQDKRFTISAQSELADKDTHNEGFDYGFNIGLAIDYQRTVMYNNVEVFVFPGLNDLGYMHVEGTLVGFNFHLDQDHWRTYIGALKGGFINRGNYWYPMVGFDGGIEFYLASGLFIGGEAGWDWKTDDKYWGSDTGHGVGYVAFKLGFTL